jgi:hypothetical protein
MICPKCKEDSAHRSERVSFADHAVNRFFFKPYSCGACRHRFYALRRDITWNNLREEFRGRLDRVRDRFRSGRQRRRYRRELLFYTIASLAVVAIMFYIAQQRA